MILHQRQVALQRFQEQDMQQRNNVPPQSSNLDGIYPVQYSGNVSSNFPGQSMPPHIDQQQIYSAPLQQGFNQFIPQQMMYMNPSQPQLQNMFMNPIQPQSQQQSMYITPNHPQCYPYDNLQQYPQKNPEQ